MAPYLGKPSSPFYTLAAEARAKISMPDRFKCRQCDQFKIPSNFSNKEIKDYQYKKSCMTGINGVTAKLRCRPCAGEQVHQLKCEGPCGITKPLDGFSKTQRRGGLKWCQDCVLWKEAAEPGTVTAAAPGTEQVSDEAYESDGWGYNSDPEISSDSDDGTVYPFLPWQGVDGAKNLDKESDKLGPPASAQSSPIVISSATQPMPCIQNRPVGVSNRGLSGTITAPQSGYLPPHIRAQNGESCAHTSRPEPAAENLIDIDADVKTVSSASNPYEDAWSSTGTLAPWSVVDNRRRNALYEPHHSLEEGTASGLGQGSALPQPSTRSNWAKPAGARRLPPRFPMPTPAPARRRRRDDRSDESQDEM